MKKLVIKSAVITLLSILFALIIIFSVFFLFFSKALGNFSAKTGNYSFSAVCYERQYKKSGNVEDLSVLADFLDARKSPEKTAKYSRILIDSEYEFKDTSEAEYYYGKYAVAQANNGEVSAAANACAEFANGIGYTEHNPFRTLVSSCASLTKEELTIVKTALDSLNAQFSENAYYVADVQTLTAMISAF